MMTPFSILSLQQALQHEKCNVCTERNQISKVLEKLKYNWLFFKKLHTNNCYDNTMYNSYTMI